MKELQLAMIRLYQKTYKFQRPIRKNIFHTDVICRFSPTCSEYTYQAIKKYGAAKGTVLGLKRVIRCGPWSKGGYDPVK